MDTADPSSVLITEGTDGQVLAPAVTPRGAAPTVIDHRDATGNVFGYDLVGGP